MYCKILLQYTEEWKNAILDTIQIKLPQTWYYMKYSSTLSRHEKIIGRLKIIYLDVNSVKSLKWLDTHMEKNVLPMQKV